MFSKVLDLILLHWTAVPRLLSPPEEVNRRRSTGSSHLGTTRDGRHNRTGTEPTAASRRASHVTPAAPTYTGPRLRTDAPHFAKKSGKLAAQKPHSQPVAAEARKPTSADAYRGEVQNRRVSIAQGLQDATGNDSTGHSVPVYCQPESVNV